MHMNYSQIMSPRPPLPRKVGGHDRPQLLWERRPCLALRSNERMAGNKLMSMISLVQSHDHEGSPMGKEVAEVKVGRIVMADDEARCGLLEPCVRGRIATMTG